MTYTLCTSGAMIIKAGANASTTAITSGAILALFNDHAENIINVSTRKNWITSYSSLNAGVKYILDDCCSSLGAISLITYDMSGFTSRAEAQSMIDVLNYSVNRDLKLLEEEKTKDFITGA